MMTNPNCADYDRQWVIIPPSYTATSTLSAMRSLLPCFRELFDFARVRRNSSDVRILRQGVKELYERRLERIGPIPFREWWEKDMKEYGSYRYGYKLYRQALRGQP